VTVIDFAQIMDVPAEKAVFGITWEVSVKSGQEVDLRDSLDKYFKSALTDPFTVELNLRGYPEITKSLQSPLITTMSETPTRMPTFTIRTAQPTAISVPAPPSVSFRALKSTEIGVAARIFVIHVSSDLLTCCGRGASRFVEVHVEYCTPSASENIALDSTYVTHLSCRC
jgi:hypothetical protein